MCVSGWTGNCIKCVWARRPLIYSVEETRPRRMQGLGKNMKMQPHSLCAGMRTAAPYTNHESMKIAASASWQRRHCRSRDNRRRLFNAYKIRGSPQFSFYIFVFYVRFCVVSHQVISGASDEFLCSTQFFFEAVSAFGTFCRRRRRQRRPEWRHKK